VPHVELLAEPGPIQIIRRVPLRSRWSHGLPGSSGCVSIPGKLQHLASQQNHETSNICPLFQGRLARRLFDRHHHPAQRLCGRPRRSPDRHHALPWQGPDATDDGRHSLRLRRSPAEGHPPLQAGPNRGGL
jgi:hypothetical protein